MNILFHNQARLYEVLEDERAGKRYLSVVCGTIGWYDITVELTDSESADFDNDRLALDDLANRIYRYPNQFADRWVRIDDGDVVVKVDPPLRPLSAPPPGYELGRTEAPIAKPPLWVGWLSNLIRRDRR
jgi:hypothetical protein